MAPPDNGNEYLDFTELMCLEKCGDDVYRSTALAFGVAGGKRAYGGHVYAQACYAAAQTVGTGFVLHNVTGWFLIGGKTNERFTYRIRRIRDGGISTRGVDVFQDDEKACCFTCVCSFKKPERASRTNVDIRRHLDLMKEYHSVLECRRPEDHQEMPSLDLPLFIAYAKEHGIKDPFPGLELRKVDMTNFNKDKPLLERRNLKFYRAIGRMPSIEEDPNLHACAHLYASDRNSLLVIMNNLELGDSYETLASIAHTVIFHTDWRELSVTRPSDGAPQWFLQEAWAGGARHGRGLHESRLWTDDGLHIATTVQDGMVRLKSGDRKGKLGFSPESILDALEAARGARTNRL